MPATLSLQPWPLTAWLADCVSLQCALPPSLRERWAAKMKELLRPGGLLLTLIFPICDKVSQPLNATVGT